MEFKTELQFQHWIAKLAVKAGWQVHCNPDARKSSKFSTPGFPDIVLSKPGKTIFVECKMPGGTIKPAQKRWLLILSSSRVDIHVWEPKDELKIKEVICSGRR